MPLMTPADAQAVQDRAEATGRWLTWFVSVAGGQAIAWAIIADPHGGTRQPGILVADTLDEVRAMLPAGLTRREPTSVMPAGVVETWD